MIHFNFSIIKSIYLCGLTIGFCLLFHALPAQIQVSTITDAFDGSGGLELDSRGNLMIANFGRDLSNADGRQVWKLDKAGNLDLFATGLQGASGNIFDPQGNLYQSNIAGGYISKITPSGVVSTYATQSISAPVGISIDEDGNLYVCNCAGNFGNTIRKVNTGGITTLFASSPLFSCPNGITRDDNGNLYVSNFSNGNVMKITPNGSPSHFATIPGGSNGHIVYARADNVLYVASHGSSRIYRLSMNGIATSIAGSGIRGNADGPAGTATFSRPNGLAITPSGDSLYVNSSVPITDNPATNARPLNPSLIRLLRGLNSPTTPTKAPAWLNAIQLNVFPNPSKGQCQIQLDFPRSKQGKLVLLNAKGQQLQVIYEGTFQQGPNQFNINLENFPPGQYAYILHIKPFLISRQIILQ